MNETQRRVRATFQRMQDEIRQARRRRRRERVHEKELPRRASDPEYLRKTPIKQLDFSSLDHAELALRLRRKHNQPPGSAGVYVFRCNEFIKNGRAGDIAMRFAAILAVNPYLEFVCRLSIDADDEAVWQLLFAKHRHRGEWFRLYAILEELDACITHRP
jgi:hypothetical protein